MKNSTKLMEQRGALVEELETLLNSVASEERDFTEEENEKQDSFHEQIADLDNAIQRAKNNEAVFAAAAGTASSQSEAKEVAEIRGKFSITKAIQDISNTGKLQGLEAEMAQEGRSELAKAGQSARGNLTIPSFIMGEKRANEAYGVNAGVGITLQNQGDATRGIDHAPIVEGLRPVSVLEAMGATVIQATGDLVLPSLPNVEATTTAEGVTVNNIDGDFGDTKLQPKRFAMRMDLTRQMLNQSDPQLDAVIARDMSNAIANELDQHVIGTKLFASTNITDGSVVDADTCKATSYADFTRFEGDYLSNNPAGPNHAILMNPKMAAFLKSVSQSDGGAILNVGNQILGYNVFTSTNVKQQHVDADPYFSGITSTTNDIDMEPIFFVDASDLFIAQFGGLDVTIDPYTLSHNGVIRLIADYYADGNVRRSGSVQVLAGLTANQDPAA